ncbi:hypothetical protein LV716_01170 [Flagellimonas sp. HMM57]|nr:hypothetical protein [Flagellimonas sp. HMM57]UII77934.1 hypothetical protein LV716_01170 [Flagellimonas sp. HMM57]
MKQYEVYRNIRKRALIFGLPLSLFALQMVSIIGSLLVIIFSFGLGRIVGALVWNSMLFILLTKVAHRSQRLQRTPVFPKRISNKQNTLLNYEGH